MGELNVEITLRTGFLQAGHCVRGAAESGRRMILRALTAQPADHPEVLTIPETGYLKGALLEAGV